MDIATGSLQAYLQAGSPLAYAAAFAGGILASFTPCVYPVIPVTVGYIGSRSRSSRAGGFLVSLTHAAGMAIAYALLGGAAALSGKVFGEVAASAVSRLVVGILWILLGLSLFDLFRIPLPSFPGRNGSDRRSDGILGALGVGMASGLAVGPCTAPVLGALLLYVGTRQNIFFGMTLLFVFALGMGVLLVLLGTFSGLLAGLPKSGRWLLGIKRGFGATMILSGGFFLLEAAKSLL
jgi:thiol:disulfide interchange protein DsbD